MSDDVLLLHGTKGKCDAGGQKFEF